ncbi:MAG: hypothetical protein AAFO07_08025 [Bacteroidota bacterium]
MKWKLMFLALFTATQLSSNCSQIFELTNNMILVEAEVDQQSGWFIIDTGSPNLVLNKKHFQSQSTDNECYGIGGRTAYQTKHVKSFKWECYKRRSFYAPIISMNHLEKAIGKPILGLIGFDILKKMELVVDFEDQTISQLDNKSIVERDEHQSIPFDLVEHQLIIQFELDGDETELIFDTASKHNMLDKELRSSEHLITDELFLIGINQKPNFVDVIEVSAVYMESISLEDQEYALVELDSRIRANGIAGFPIMFKLNKFSINYRKKKLYIWN